MKQALLLGFIITTLTSFQTNNTIAPKLSLTALINSRDAKHVTLKIILTNNTSDTIKYESWDCSWQDSYSVDNEKWKIVVNLCFKNGRETIEIPPYRSVSSILELDRIAGISKSRDSKFRIGFHYIPHHPELKNIPAKISQQEQEDFIVWSNIVTPSYFTRTARW